MKWLSNLWDTGKFTSRAIAIAIIYALVVEIHKDNSNSTIVIGIVISLNVLYIIITGFINNPKELEGIIKSFKGTKDGN